MAEIQTMGALSIDFGPITPFFNLVRQLAEAAEGYRETMDSDIRRRFDLMFLIGSEEFFYGSLDLIHKAIGGTPVQRPAPLPISAPALPTSVPTPTTTVLVK